MRNCYFTFAFKASEASLVPTPLLERCLVFFACVIRPSGVLLMTIAIGCAPLDRSTPQHPGPVTVEGAHGTLSTSQSAAVVANAVADAPDPTATNALVGLMENLSDEPLYKDNSVGLLVDGPATYDAMLAAVRAARSLHPRRDVHHRRRRGRQNVCETADRESATRRRRSSALRQHRQLGSF